MFLNDNQIYVTTKFMHSTQILVSVLAKKTFVCTLSASISDAASSSPQKPYTSRLTDKALRISAKASHIINQPFIRSNLFSGDYQRNGTNMAFIIKWINLAQICTSDTLAFEELISCYLVLLLLLLSVSDPADYKDPNIS